MCTAVTLRSRGLFLGRTLDHPFSYGEALTITPRRFPLRRDCLHAHYAMIGMAHTALTPQGTPYPLYYDAVNEKGLCIAALSFPVSAVYEQPAPDRENVAVYELIPWLLAQFETVAQVCDALGRICLADLPFSSALPTAPLHWLIADAGRTVAAEPAAGGLRLYDDPAGVLTNEPPFPEQLSRLAGYMHLSPKDPLDRFAPGLCLSPAAHGMGAFGLPGDLSPASRFVRAAFLLGNARPGPSREEAVGQVFDILGCVSLPRGSCELSDGALQTTLYTACCCAQTGTYYCRTADCRRICSACLHSADLQGSTLVRILLPRDPGILRLC